MLRRIIFFLLISLIYTTSWASESVTPGGLIDQITYVDDSSQAQIHGHFNGSVLQSKSAEFRAEVRGKTGRINQKSIENNNFDIEINFEDPLPSGLSELNLFATFPDGTEIKISTPEGRPGLLYNPKIKIRHWILLSITLLIIFLAYTKTFRNIGLRLSSWVQHKQLQLLAGIILTFSVLIIFGVTGSSVRIALEGPVAKAISKTTGSDFKIFKLQYSRGDEWGILTPNVFAQINHDPKFPIINQNLGIDGQNMGVLGMTGVPVAQWAAIARPATWGYFFLPTRQAQSWQWQLPFWGCLLAVWWLLNIFSPSSSGRNLALSALFCVAPYAAAWSNWPLYFTLFPTLAFACSVKLLRAAKPLTAILWGVAIGLAIAAWVLTLYPPWMISIGTLVALLGIGWIFDQHRSLTVKSTHVAGLLFAALASILILGSWWLDTREAVELIKNTVYPGQRTTLTGGTNGLVWAFRGYTNAESIAFGGDDPWTNQPEISSYIWLPFAMAWLCIAGVLRDRKNRGILVGISIFIIFYSTFAFIGIPEWLAKISQWGRVPTNRTDVALGLALIILISLANHSWFKPATSKANIGLLKISAALAAAGSAWLAYTVFKNIPITTFPNGSPVYIASFIIFITFCSWWLVQGKLAAPITLLFAFFLMASLPFNPITKAPKSVALSPEVRRLASDETGHLQRTLLVSGEGMGPHLLAASGLPTVNGVLAYPHSTLWAQLRLPKADWPTVNRYQHLAFQTGAPSHGKSYSVSSPWMEWVVVTIDAEKFDFSQTGAARVAAFGSEASQLRKSPKLKEIGTHNNLVWFSVIN